MNTEDIQNIRLLVAIINHNENKNAIRLKEIFQPTADTILIDSGSELNKEEKKQFDYLLPNVFYNGLLNKAFECLQPTHTHLFLITSDVLIKNAAEIVSRIHEVYTTYKDVRVYAPSSIHSTHHHQNNLGTFDIRKVTFTEGFCFVIPKEYLNQICPIDLSVNKIGHGIDMFMGFLCMKNKKWAVVDDRITVDHPHKSGYSDRQARTERDNWYSTREREAQRYHYWISKDILKNKFGYWLIKKIIRF